MIVKIIKDSSKSWYTKYIGKDLEVRAHGNNDKYFVFTDTTAKSYKNRKKYIIKTDCEILPL
jgi:hypothetical protein